VAVIFLTHPLFAVPDQERGITGFLSLSVELVAKLNQFSDSSGYSVLTLRLGHCLAQEIRPNFLFLVRPRVPRHSLNQDYPAGSGPVT
jgi:hypothetical protein